MISWGEVGGGYVVGMCLVYFLETFVGWFDGEAGAAGDILASEE